MDLTISGGQFAQKVPSPHDLGQNKLTTDMTSDGQVYGERERVRGKTTHDFPLTLTLSPKQSVQANGERFLRLFEGEGTFWVKPSRPRWNPLSLQASFGLQSGTSF